MIARITLSALILALILFFFLSHEQAGELEIVLSGILQGHIISSSSANSPEKGGLALLGSRVLEIRKNCLSSGRNFLWLDNGDNLSGTPDAYYTQGESVTRIMAHLPVDAWMTGNREFDFGRENLLRQAQNCNFILSSNVTDSSGQALPKIRTHIEKTYGSKKVLILGITPPNTADLTLRSNVEGLVFSDLKETLVRFDNLIKKSDLLILITQFTSIELREISELFSDMKCPVLLIYNRFPPEHELIRKCAHDVFFVSHDGVSKGKTIEKLKLNLDHLPELRLSAETEEISVVTAPDPGLLDIISEHRRNLEKIIHKKAGETKHSFEIDNYQECAIGNLLCDLLRKVSGADIALTNTTGIRNGLPGGDVSMEDVYKLMPFDNSWVTLKMKGADVKNIFQRCFSKKQAILQVSGIRLTAEIFSDTVSVNLSVNEVPLLDDIDYVVVTNSFLAQGGDDYREFKNGKVLKEGRLIRREFEEFLAAESPISGQTEGRIVIISRGN